MSAARKNPFRVSNPELLPAKRYYDEEFYQLECEHLWPHVWQMACRLEQIPNVGDWVEYSNLGKSVIVVRSQDGVKAFHNHCRHRGVPIAGGKGNEHGNCSVKGFICPFHGWRWNMNGECTFVYGRHMFNQDLLAPSELALKSCRVELWGGCAFINFDDKAPSFRECIGPVADRLEAHGVGKLRSEWWFATVLPANWKTAMEAFQEGYHVMKTHPQLQQAVPEMYGSRYGNDFGGVGVPVNPNISVRDNIRAHITHMEQLCVGMGGGLLHAKELEIVRTLADVELPEDPAKAIPAWYRMVNDEITKQLRHRGEDVPDLNAVKESHPVAAVEFLFPNYFLLVPQFTSFSSYRIRPLGPESCLFEIWSLTHFPPGQEPKPPMDPVVLPFDSQEFPRIPRQDYSNIPIQQKGMHSEGFEVLRMAKDVEGLISNYHRLIDGYIAGVAPEKLARGNQMLGGNFDGRILDLGF